MDIKTLLASLHKELSCSVCMVTFTEPIQLPCLHRFCLHCLVGIKRNSGHHDVIICPCRRESQVPGGNLKDLPANFRINSLLEVLVIKECSSTGVKCGNCDRRKVEGYYCFQCCVFWCEECITVHNLLRERPPSSRAERFWRSWHRGWLKRPRFVPDKATKRKKWNFSVRNKKKPFAVHAL